MIGLVIGPGCSDSKSTPDAGTHPGPDGGGWPTDDAGADGTTLGDAGLGDDGPSDGHTDGSPLALPDVVHFVNPLIGTGPSNANVVGGSQGGGVFPGAVAPFGMVQWSPDTSNGQPSGYNYQDTAITGFSLTHLSGASCANAGDVPILPSLDSSTAQLVFSHQNEHAGPGYYDVTFDNGIRTELTATTRTGFARFTFPAQGDAFLLIDATRTPTIPHGTGTIHTLGNDSFAGSASGGNFCGTKNAYTIFFAAKFDRPWKAATVQNGKAAITFDTGAHPAVLLKIGISYVSEANAQLNLDGENTAFDFDGIRNKAKDTWNTKLNAIQVSGGSDPDTTKLYTALYHSLLEPNVYSDVNGQFRGFDNAIYSADPGRTHYANFSSWDIYRSEIQLISALYPEIASDMVQSLVRDAGQCGGAFPKWAQNNDDTNLTAGDPGSIVAASAYAFGATKFDTQAAMGVMAQTGAVPDMKCNGKMTMPALRDYESQGYISGGESGVASATLEYTARDFAISQFAKAIGQQDNYRMALDRSANWQNELHPNGLIQVRTGSGAWKVPLDNPGEGANTDYLAGNAEQYTWMVPYDPRTLFDSIGGNAAVIARLDKFFGRLNAGLSDPNFYMGNEPDFGTPWLYDWAGAPWRTQDVVRRIVDEQFTTLPGGLPGTDDLGAMSSWFVWASLGLYPAIPGVGGFAVSTPLFPSAVVHLGNGQSVQITATGAPLRYVQSAKLNGTDTTRLWVPWDAVVGGATIEYVLGAAQSTWGSAPADAPPSFSPGTFTTMADARDSDGIGSDGTTSTTDFDGFGSSYSSQALAAAGVTGSTVTHGGVTFGWPVGTSALDNFIAVGQTIKFTSPQPTGHLAWLAASSNGATSGTGVLHYTDGTSTQFTLSISDWTLGAGGVQPVAGNEIAVTTSYRNTRGTRENVTTYVFYTSTQLDTTRALASVTLPNMVSSGRLHVFSVALAP